MRQLRSRSAELERLSEAEQKRTVEHLRLADDVHRSADPVRGQVALASRWLQALAARLQREGAEAFVTSWDGILGCIEAKSAALTEAGRTP